MAERNQRHVDAARMLELADAAARAEAAAARGQLQAFVADMTNRGLDPEPLRATLLSGRRVKTPLLGWYLNKAGTVAVGADGEFYQLVVPGSPLARFTGVVPEPARPVLEIGRGGKDGETGPLADFLSRALAEYASR